MAADTLTRLVQKSLKATSFLETLLENRVSDYVKTSLIVLRWDLLSV